MHVPDGWFDYSRFGTPIGGTKIICVKTPLKKAFNTGKSRGEVEASQLDYRRGVPTEEEFTPTQLVERLKVAGWNLKAVIDLTFTSRYYSPKELEDLGVQHSKIFCPGREIPSDDVYTNFAQSLSDNLSSCESTDLVAVHCTHGLNRTGYLVCRYLVDNYKFLADEAIQAFNKARGYDIERENYLDHLRKGCPPLAQSKNQPHRSKKGGRAQQHQVSSPRDRTDCQWREREPPSDLAPAPLFSSHHPPHHCPYPTPHYPPHLMDHHAAAYSGPPDEHFWRRDQRHRKGDQSSYHPLLPPQTEQYSRESERGAGVYLEPDDFSCSSQSRRRRRPRYGGGSRKPRGRGWSHHDRGDLWYPPHPGRGFDVSHDSRYGQDMWRGSYEQPYGHHQSSNSWHSSNT